MTRQDVMLLGQRNEPWRFIPVGEQVLRQAAGDEGVRFVLAVNYAKMGLKTAAGEHLGRLSERAAADPAVGALREAVGRLPQDRVGGEELESTLRGNLAALAGNPSRGVDLRGMVDEWKAREERLGREWFRTRHGDVVRRVARPRAMALGFSEKEGESGSGSAAAVGIEWQWEKFVDGRSLVAGMRLPHEEAGDGGAVPPYTVEGVDPPWMLRRVAEGTPLVKSALGYQARLNVVQADVMEFLDGLAQGDLREVLGSFRTRVFVGEGAGGEFAADLMGRLDQRLHGPLIVSPGIGKQAMPTVESSIRGAMAAQQREAARLMGEVEKIYSARDASWWRERFAGALTEEGTASPRTDLAPPIGATKDTGLRVLIPTCLYSTYIRHAAADLAAALNGLGHEAEVLIEPEACAHMSTIAYQRRLVEFRPDVVVTINYPRASMRGMLPLYGKGGVPVVCWLQDSMPHLFDEAVGRSQGELDFVMGNLLPDLFSRYGYRREIGGKSHAMDAAVVASAEKFGAGRSSSARACELLYVSHQSLPARRLHEQRVGEAKGNERVQAAMESLYGEIERITGEPMRAYERCEFEGGLIARLREATVGVVRRYLGEQAAGDERAVGQIFAGYAMPLADRMLRHETLGWAAEICRARGWRFHLYGNGWEAHETLGAFARGGLAHDGALRDAYGSAAAALQVSLHTPVHQRIFECALAGGLPVCRVHEDDIATLRHWAASEIARDGEADACLRERVSWGGRAYAWLGYRAARSEAAGRYNAMRRALGLEEEELVWLHGRHEAAIKAGAAVGEGGLSALPDEGNLLWLMRAAGETCCVSREGMERMLVRAVEDETWRGEQAGFLRGRVEERLTHTALARRMMRMVREGL